MLHSLLSAGRTRHSRVFFLVGVAASALLLLAIASADTASVDFETYTVGNVDGQDGWQADGSAGSGCAVYDVAVASQATYPTFGTKSLRMSDAVTSGCFGDQTFSKPVNDEAGETAAQNGGLSGGTRQPFFSAQWDFASADNSGEQAGLQIVASPDRGDGARMSWVQMADTPTGLDVNFYDYQSGVNEVGCTTGSNFIFSPVATGLSRTVPHTIKLTVQFVDGANNDIAKVYVDGVLLHTGTSWEGYYAECESNPTRTVDSLIFRGGGTAHPGNAGKGFYIDNLVLTSGPLPVVTPNPTPNPSAAVGGGVELITGGSSGTGPGVVAALAAGVALLIGAALGGNAWSSRRRGQERSG